MITLPSLRLNDGILVTPNIWIHGSTSTESYRTLKLMILPQTPPSPHSCFLLYLFLVGVNLVEFVVLLLLGLWFLYIKTKNELLIYVSNYNMYYLGIGCTIVYSISRLDSFTGHFGTLSIYMLPFPRGFILYTKILFLEICILASTTQVYLYIL